MAMKLNVYKKSLPPFNRDTRIKLIFLGSCFFAVIYLVMGGYPLRVPSLAPLCILDSYIPWLPFSVLIYLSQFVFLLLGVIYAPSQRTATITYYSYLLAIFLSGFAFVLYPTFLPRLSFSEQNHPVLGWCYQFLYSIDIPNNCFPSLHTSLALIAASSLRTRSFVWQIVASLWSAAIILSTLTTKQHCILDVVAGMLLFSLCIWLCRKGFNKRLNGTITFKNYSDRQSSAR
jgi:membrane-associated phospholipid phosphatase